MPRRRRSSHGPTAIRRRRAALALFALLALAAGVAVGVTRGGQDGPGAGGQGSAAGGPAERAGSEGADRGGAEHGAAREGPDARDGGAGGAGPGDAEAGASPTPAEQARAAVARMSLGRQVGQLLVISFSGAAAPAYVTDALRGGRAAGVILFGDNAPDAASVRALTRALQRAAGGDAIVSLDQEGGDIRTLAFAPPEAGQARQATPAAARASAAAAAGALRDAGVNVTLGPVADVATTPGSFMAGRAYPGDGAAVGRSVAAAVRAYRAAGVEPTPKHFPGVGGATQNTDYGSAAIDRTREALIAEDLAPYRAAIGAGARIVMTGHARFPALDGDRIASQSHAVVTGLLRDELGFEGVAMTDSLEADAVDAATPGEADVGLAAVRALEAGNDLLLLTGPGSFPLAREAVLAAARRDPAIRARVAESAARVVALRRVLASTR